MGIIAWLILGLLAGWIASLIMKTDHQQGMFTDIILGIIGAMVGGFVFGLFGGEGVTGLNIYSLLVAVTGSIVLIGVGRAIRS